MQNPAAMTRTNYIFVDFENVHEVDLDRVAKKPVVVILVLGEKHKKLSVELVKKLLKYQDQVRLIEAGRSGKNALDFVLAYRIGVESQLNPKGSFHIVSRDTGFDPLIDHLNHNGILAKRHETFASALGQSAGLQPALPDRIGLVVERLTKNKKNRPKREKTLRSQINASFQKQMSKGELDEMLKELIGRKVIEITPQGAVIYKI